MGNKNSDQTWPWITLSHNATHMWLINEWKELPLELAIYIMDFYYYTDYVTSGWTIDEFLEGQYPIQCCQSFLFPEAKCYDFVNGFDYSKTILKDRNIWHHNNCKYRFEILHYTDGEIHAPSYRCSDDGWYGILCNGSKFITIIMIMDAQDAKFTTKVIDETHYELRNPDCVVILEYTRDMNRYLREYYRAHDPRW